MNLHKSFTILFCEILVLMFKKVHKNYYYLSKTNDIHVIYKQIQVKQLSSYCEETTPDPCKREKCDTSL